MAEDKRLRWRTPAGEALGADYRCVYPSGEFNNTFGTLEHRHFIARLSALLVAKARAAWFFCSRSHMCIRDGGLFS